MKNLYPLFRFARTIWTLILIGASVNSTTGQSAGCTCKEVSVKLDSNVCSVNLTKEILDLDAACSANLRIAVEDNNPANGSVIDAPGNWTYILYTSSGDTICMGKVRAEDKSGPKLVERIDPCGRVIVSSDPAAVWRDTFPAADLGKILNIEASWQDSNYPWYTGTAVFKNRCGHFEENDCTVTSQVMDQVVKYNFCTGLQFNPIHAKISRIWTGIDCNGNKTSVIQEIYFLIPAFFSIQQQYLEQGPVSGLSLTDGGKMEWIFNGETCSPPQGSVMLDSFLANYYIFNNPQQCSAKGARGFSFFNQAVNAGRAEIAYNYPTIPYSVNARILKEASLCGVSKEVTAIISIYDWCSKTYQYDTVFIKWMDPRLEGVSITLQQPIVIPAKPGQCSAELRIDSTNLRDILGIKFNEKCSPEIEKMFVESCLDDSGNPSLGPCAYWCAPAYPTRWDNGQAMIADIPAGAHRLVITSKNSCGEESVLNRVNFIITADSLTACDTLLCSGYEIWPKLAKVRGRCGRTVVPDAVSLQFIDTKMLVWRDTFLSTDLPWVLNSMESWQNANYRYFAGYPTFWDSCLIVQSPECRCEVTLQVKDEVAYFPCETMTSDQVMAKIIRTFTGTDCWGHSASVVQEIFFVWPKFQPLGVREILLHGGTCSADNEAILSELKKRYYIFDDPYSCDPKEKYAWFREAVGTQSGNARKFLDSSYNFEVVLKKQEEICSRSQKLEVVVQVLDGCTGQTTILDSLWLIWGDLTAPKAIIPSGPIQLMADPEKETASFGIDPNSLEYYFGINITDNCGKDFVTEVEIWSYLESAGGVEKTWQKVNYPVKWVDFGDTLQRLMVQDIPIGSHRLHITATDLCRNQSRLDSILVQVSASNRCDPVRITLEPSSQFVQVGGTATFIVKATGTAPFSYQWRKNGVNIPGANRAAYIIPTVALSDTNSLFNCVIANCNGDSVAVSKEARLTTGCGCPDVVVFMESPTTPFQLTNEILGNTNCKTGYTISVVDNSPGDTNRIDAPGYWTYGLFDNLGKLQCWARVQAMVADCSPPGVPVPVTEQTECQALETTPTPTLNWRNVPGAKRYEVSVSKYPYGSANSIPLHNSSCISDSSYTVFPALQPGMVYRWDVRSMTSCDQFCVSDNSAGRYFYLPPVINQSQLTKGKAVLSTPEQRIAAPGFVRYQWYKDGEPVGGNSNTYIAWQQGTYTVRLTYAGGIYCGAATTISSKPFYFEGGQSTSCECREVEVILDSSTCSFNLTKEILGLDTTLCYPSTSIRVEDTNPGNGSLIDAPGYWPYMLYSPLGDTICFGKVRAESISAPILVQRIGRCGQTVLLSDSFPVWRDTFLVSDIEKVLDVEASWLDSNYFWYAGAAVFRGACDKPEGLGCLVSSEVKDTIVYFSCPKDNTEAKISRMWIGRDCFGNETKAIQEIFFVWPKFQPLGEKK
ncbi:MAG: hypothetical protein IPH16_10410 [Haliscomenobacter sp.]|nr:hypothetical protein [Haliscomenobacter sp.]